MRLIDADSIHYTRVLSQQGLNMELAAKVVIDDMPTIDAAPVVHGRWINQDSTYTKYQCSACKERNFDGVGRYCPYCGAKMDGEQV
jgi:hypothetical protein